MRLSCALNHLLTYVTGICPTQLQPPPSPLLAVPNVTAHPSTASVPITVLLYRPNGPLLCGFNAAIKGYNYRDVCMWWGCGWLLIDRIITREINSRITIRCRRFTARTVCLSPEITYKISSLALTSGFSINTSKVDKFLTSSYLLLVTLLFSLLSYVLT